MRDTQQRFLTSRKPKLVVCVLLLPALITLAALRFVLSKTEPAVMAKTDAPEPSAAGQISSAIPTQRLEIELITVRATGFEPAEIKRAAGPFLLAIDNRSGLDEVTLRLAREGGSQVREIRLAVGRLKWREKVNLPPGNYSLAAPSQPGWLCRITIAP